MKEPFVTDGGDIVWRFTPIPLNEDAEALFKVAGAVLLGGVITVGGLAVLACLTAAHNIRETFDRIAERRNRRRHERNSEG
jgi:hypothetical protein